MALCVAGWLAYLMLSPKTPSVPPAPAQSAAPQEAGPGAPVFDVVRVDAQGNAVLAGRAAPGAGVTVKDNGVVIGTAVADAQGAFVILPEKPLAAGAQSITLSETLGDGSVVESQETASIDVPVGGGPALAVLSGPNGSTVLSGQGPAAGTLAMGAVDYDANGHAIFSGTAPAGAHVTVSLGGKEIGAAVADASGRWSFATAVPGANGTLDLSATAANGSKLAGTSAPFVLESLQGAMANGHIVITPGDNLWIIARHVYGHGILYTLIYSANVSQIHNPNLIFPGQNFSLPKPKG